MPIRTVNGIIHIRFQALGHEYNKTTKLPDNKNNRTLAQRIEVKEKERIVRRLRLGEEDIESKPFDEAYQALLQWIEQKHAVSPHTILSYHHHTRDFTRYFGSMPLAGIQRKHVQRYIMSKKHLKPTTMRLYLSYLSVLFNHGKTMGWCEHNPVRELACQGALPSLKGCGRIRIVSREEDRAYFAECQNLKYRNLKAPLHDYTRLLLIHGLRPGEGRTLNRARINFDRSEIEVGTKNPGTHRLLAMIPESEEIFRRLLADGREWLFPNLRDPTHPISHYTIKAWHSRIQQKMGMDFPLYTFRHTFATRQAEMGTDAFTLKDLMGHASIVTTMKYVHIAREHKQQAMKNYALDLLKSGN